DYPYYFRATSGEATSIRLQKGSQFDSLVPRSGWSLALQDEYETKSAWGKVTLEGILQSDWGLQWRHVRDFAPNVTGSFQVATRSLDTFNADAGLSHRLRDGRLATRANFAAYPGVAPRIAATADYYFNPNRIGRTGLYHRLGLGLAYTNQDFARGGSLLEGSVSSGLAIKPWRPHPKTAVRPSMDWVLTLDSQGEASRYMRFSLSVEQRINSQQYLDVRYSVDRRTGGASSLFRNDVRQQVFLNYNLVHGSAWSAFVTANYDLTNSLLFGSGNLSYRFLPKYRLNIWSTFYGSDAGFNETEFTVFRQIGRQEIGVRYSTFDHRISLQLAGASF
ncbi:MAG: hypothetical protein ACE5O2_00370, partial [Armatimonadota bacterium]